MLHPFIEQRDALPNFDSCFGGDEKSVAPSFIENSFCKPFLEDETVVPGPSFALDEAEKRLNNPVNITVRNSVIHRNTETPLVFRKMQQQKCTDFFQNRRPTPLPKAVAPRALLQPSPSPCTLRRPPCMAELFNLQMGEEQEMSSPIGNKTKNRMAEERSMWTGGTGLSFGFTCTPIKEGEKDLTPITEKTRRTPCAFTPGLTFVFDSPLKVEKRTDEPISTPVTSKRKGTKRKLRQRLPMSNENCGKKMLFRSTKKLKLSPIVQIMRRETPMHSPQMMWRESPLHSPAYEGMNSKSNFTTGKKLLLRSPLKCGLSPVIMKAYP